MPQPCHLHTPLEPCHLMINLLKKKCLELDEWFHAYLCSQACLPAQALAQHIIHNTEMLFPWSKTAGNFHIIYKGRGKHFQVKWGS